MIRCAQRKTAEGNRALVHYYERVVLLIWKTRRSTLNHYDALLMSYQARTVHSWMTEFEREVYGDPTIGTAAEPK